jgi:hypothetical protein
MSRAASKANSAQALALAPQGRKVTSREQRPRKSTHPLTPFPSPVRRGEGCRRRGEGPPSRGFRPRLLMSLPCREHGTVKPLRVSLVEPVACSKESNAFGIGYTKGGVFIDVKRAIGRNRIIGYHGETTIRNLTPQANFSGVMRQTALVRGGGGKPSLIGLAASIQRVRSYRAKTRSELKASTMRCGRPA